jgi:hypothetical protein
MIWFQHPIKMIQVGWKNNIMDTLRGISHDSASWEKPAWYTFQKYKNVIC